MKSENLVFNLVFEKVKNLTFNREAFCDGIKQYALENKLDKFMEGVSDETIAARMIEDYMQPLLETAPEGLVEYFQSYQIYKEFNLITRQLLIMAEMVYYKKSVTDDVSQLESRLIELSMELYNYKSLKVLVDKGVSESLLNIDFIKGKSDKLSMGLYRRVNM